MPRWQQDMLSLQLQPCMHGKLALVLQGVAHHPSKTALAEQL